MLIVRRRERRTLERIYHFTKHVLSTLIISFPIPYLPVSLRTLTPWQGSRRKDKIVLYIAHHWKKMCTMAWHMVLQGRYHHRETRNRGLRRAPESRMMLHLGGLTIHGRSPRSRRNPEAATVDHMCLILLLIFGYKLHMVNHRNPRRSSGIPKLTLHLLHALGRVVYGPYTAPTFELR